MSQPLIDPSFVKTKYTVQSFVKIKTNLTGMNTTKGKTFDDALIRRNANL